MKITKEKATYFLSLNLVTCFIYLILALLALWREADEGTIFYHLINIENIIIFYLLILIGLSSAIAFLCAYKKYNILKVSFLVVTPLILVFIAILLFSTIKYGFDTYQFFSLSSILSIFYFINLIVLKITDPLRRKIKW